MSQQLSERTHAPTSSASQSSPSPAVHRTRSSVQRRDRSRRRLRAFLCAGGTLAAAAGLVLIPSQEPSLPAEAGLITASGTRALSVPESAGTDPRPGPAAASSPETVAAEEKSSISTLSDGKPIVTETEASVEEPAEAATEPAEKPAAKEAKEPAEKPVEKPAEKPAEEPPLGAPLDELSVASPYGNRINPMSGNGQEMHTGTDFAGACGTPVLASGTGTVTESGWHAYGGGQRIVIDHGKGMKTTYNHLSALGTAVGGKVDRGEPIGAVGTTGNSTGCHLHFEVVIDGKTVDPSGLL